MVKECTVNVQSGNDQPDHKAQHVKFVAANHFKHAADNGKSDNNDAPCDAFLCIFGLVAMLNTVDACNKLNDAADKRSCKTQIECKISVEAPATFATSTPTPPMITPKRIESAAPIIIRMPVTFKNF